MYIYVCVFMKKTGLLITKSKTVPFYMKYLYFSKVKLTSSAY